MSGASKFDGDKPRLELIPDRALEEVARAFMDGSKKYSDYNFYKGMDWSRIIGAIMRHTRKFNRGEDYADDSGVHHLAHAAADALILLEYYLRGIGTDNRPPKFVEKDDRPSSLDTPLYIKEDGSVVIKGITI